MPVPAILGMMALDPVVDFVDTGIDVADFITGQIVLKQNQVTQAMVSFEMLMTIKSYIDDQIEDIEDDYEISKIQMALYNPKILNKLIGDALNFGRPSKDVVEWHESTCDWDIPSWLQWAEDAWFAVTGLPQDHYDFHHIYKFRDESDTADLWMTDELAYINAKFGRRW